MVLGKILQIKKNRNRVEFMLEQAQAGLEFLTDSMVRIFVDLKEDKNLCELTNHYSQDKIDVEVLKGDGCVTLKTGKLIIRVYDEFKIDIYDKNEMLLCRDYKGKRIENLGLDEVSKNLLKKEGQHEGSSKPSHKIEVVKCMEQDEYFYGLGDKTGFLNKRGYEYEMWNTDNPAPHVESFKSLYKSIPFLITSRAHCVFGMFFANSYKTYYDLGKEDREYYYFAADDGNLDYYFIYGENMKQVVTEYTRLTGRTKRPPMWSLGYHQSRWGYNTEEDARNIVNRLRELEIPCDAIHLDLAYMQDCKVFTWNKKGFPRPKAFVEDLRQMGMNVVPIIDPGIKKEQGYKVYDECMAHQYYAETPDGEAYTNEVWPGEVVYPNFMDEEARTWWGDQHKTLLDMGITGIWNDMNEPASFNGEIPEEIVFKSQDRQLQHKQIHNLYGHFMAKATYEGIKKQTGKRPFIVSRAAFSGTQKYAAVWTGDNHSLWLHLQMSIPQLCNLGLSGIPFAGCDVGGYGGDTTRELLIRWYQVGCFYPFFRNHTTLSSRSQEPWAFDESCTAIIKQYIELRYQLLPYLYDCFINEEQTGLPIMQPLVLQYEKDAKVKELNDEFMVGEQILVAPIVEQGKDYRAIYLPEGRWIDYWTGEEITGKQTILKEAPIEICPIYIKSGSIIPMYPVMQHVRQIEVESLMLNLYGEEGEYIHYQDNGVDYAYEQGEYNIYKFTVRNGYFYVDIINQGYEKKYKKLYLKYRSNEYQIDLNEEHAEVKL